MGAGGVEVGTFVVMMQLRLQVSTLLKGSPKVVSTTRSLQQVVMMLVAD